jgi:hypothetical protein
MPEWSSYSLADFLMFSPRTYWRMVEQYNRAFWPLQLATLAIGLFALWRPRSRAAFVALAGVWLWVAWAFLWRRYAEINWPARWAALAWVVQALMLLALALSARRTRLPGRFAERAGFVLCAAALLYPLASWAASGRLEQAGVFGLMPEPTALFTLGLLLSAPGTSQRTRCLLAVIPALSLLVAAAALQAMAAVQ